MANMVPTHEVGRDSILLIGTSWFRITNVREPAHPAYPGAAWEYEVFSKGAWGKSGIMNALYADKWNLITPEMRALAFPEI